ncbi:MAG: hypothetical protein HYZ53_12390 [Planctomycetes bacterium]|nr:hypothetical protein [Planctomycetota bacterium]
MGDLVLRLPVKTAHGDRARTLAVYVDGGASTTLVREDLAKALGHLLTLHHPGVFRGLGNGRFVAQRMVLLLVRIERVFRTWGAFVVSTRGMEEEILVGHDLIQKFNIRLDPRGRGILADTTDSKREKRVYAGTRESRTRPRRRPPPSRTTFQIALQREAVTP